MTFLKGTHLTIILKHWYLFQQEKRTYLNSCVNLLLYWSAYQGNIQVMQPISFHTYWSFVEVLVSQTALDAD